MSGPPNFTMSNSRDTTPDLLFCSQNIRNNFTDIEIIPEIDFKWVHCTLDETLPHNAVVGGYDANGDTIYVGRASHEGDMIPAKVIPAKKSVYIAYGGREHKKYDFEVLVQPEFDWEICSNGVIPSGAVVAGHTSNGEDLYVGRINYNHARTIGKVQPSRGCLDIPFGGREHSFRDYEVLVSH